MKAWVEFNKNLPLTFIIDGHQDNILWELFSENIIHGIGDGKILFKNNTL